MQIRAARATCRITFGGKTDLLVKIRGCTRKTTKPKI